MSSFNHHNQNYYQSFGTAAVPDLLATARPIQEALRLCIEKAVPTDPIKVLELGFGSRPDRYHHILKYSQRNWDITLSDFSDQVLPPPSFQYRRLKLDLLKDSLPTPSFDAVISTYVFDSIDFPEDRYQNGKHYPGGLIRIARQFLIHSHLFITIDKTLSKDQYEPAGGAKFKALDLSATAAELNHQGFSVSLENLNDFLARYGQQLPLDLSDHSCLIVRH